MHRVLQTRPNSEKMKIVARSVAPRLGASLSGVARLVFSTAKILYECEAATAEMLTCNAAPHEHRGAVQQVEYHAAVLHKALRNRTQRLAHDQAAKSTNLPPLFASLSGRVQQVPLLLPAAPPRPHGFFRWSGFIFVAAKRALAPTFVELPLESELGAAGLHELLADARWQEGPQN